MKVIRTTKGEKLKKGWVIQLYTYDMETGKKRNNLYKVVKVTNSSAVIVPFSSVKGWIFEDRNDEQQFYNTLNCTHISPHSSVDVVGMHRNNLDKIALNNK
jgi:hypothetical protein